MTEFQIISQFNSFLISNALYLMVFTFLLFMAYGGVYRMYQDGATIVVSEKPFSEPFDFTQFATNWTSIVGSLLTAIVVSRQL